MHLKGGAADAIRVFISYSRSDLETADRFVAALENEGFKVVIDRRDLPYGEEWLRELTDFIAGSDTVVALVSPRFLASKACSWELGQSRATNKRIIPVVIDAISHADLPEAIGRIQLLPAEGMFTFETHFAALVTALNTNRQWIKEHTRLADRAHQWIGEKRPSALLLRGSALKDAEEWKDRQPKAAPPPSDEIFELMLASRRAATRRQKWIAAASAFAALFALSLAGAAALQWQRAERSYSVARTNLDLLIKDLGGEMQNSEGMTVTTVNRILEDGQALARNLEKASGGDLRLDASRAAMYYQFGKTYQKIGRRDDATRASSESLALARKLIAVSPKDEEFAFLFVESLDLAGDLEREAKHYSAAHVLLDEAVRIGSVLNRKRPANEDYAIALSKALVRLGDLERIQKNHEAAKAHYTEAFEKTSVPLRLLQGNSSFFLQREVSWTYNKLGDVEADLGNFDQAEAGYRSSLCLRMHLFDIDPNNTLLRHDISWNYEKIAAVNERADRLDRAIDALFSALRVRRKLMLVDTRNLIWRRDAASALHQIGDLKGKTGDLPNAMMFYLAAADIRNMLKRDAPGDNSYAAAFDKSMTMAQETREKILEEKLDWAERPFRDVVTEEEQDAEAKAQKQARNASVCWSEILAGLAKVEASATNTLIIK